MGDKVGLLRAVSTCLTDTLAEVAGHLIVRLVRRHDEGETDLYVDGQHRWPSSGMIVVTGVVYTYTSHTVTPTENILHDLNEWKPYPTPAFPDPAALSVGLKYAARAGEKVTYYGRDLTDLDDMVTAFFLGTAVSTDLDMFSRNYGLSRPRGMTDDMFRELLKVLIYLDASTFYAVEKVLDVLVGAGNYEVWDTPLDDDDHHIVFVNLAPSPSDQYRGKTFLCGAEEQVSFASYTVTTTYEPNAVYGVYARDAVNPDPSQARYGTNYLMVEFNGFTDAANPSWLQSSLSVFIPSDYQGSAILSTVDDPSMIWKIQSVLGPTQIELGLPDNPATISAGAPTTLTSDSPVFRSWMEGHSIQITTASDPGNYQTATIATFETEYVVNLSSMSGGGWVGSDSGIVFSIVPNYGSLASIFFYMVRYSMAGSTITTDPAAGVLPANVWVDYATIPSAQLMRNYTLDGNDQYPFYLYDDTWFVTDILDLILAAGCHPEVVRLF